MHPLVRDLYKRFMLAGREYPAGLDHVRTRVKQGFRETELAAGGTGEAAIKAAVRQGRWHVKEMVAITQLKKYRAMREKYGGR